MLAKCSTLIECEKVLAEAIGKVAFIGQVELSEKEVSRLGELIKKRLKNGIPDGIKDLTENSPATLACYLVGHGIYNYRDGDYWTTFSESSGLADANWQTKTGQRFLYYLRQMKKTVIASPDAHKYIANFLLHGGIPQSCLPEYFEQVVQPAVFKDLIDRDDIALYLDELRADEQRRWELAEEIRILHQELHVLEQKGKQVARLLGIQEEMYCLQEQIDTLPLPANLPEDYAVLHRRLQSQLAEITRKQEILAGHKQECLTAIQTYRREDEQIVETAKAVESAVEEYHRLSELATSITGLQEEYQKSGIKLEHYLAEMGQQSNEAIDTILPEMPIDELIAALSEGVTLQDRLLQKEAELSKFEVAPVKLGLLLWSGLLCLTGCIPVVLLTSAQPAFWILLSLGLALVLPAWRRYCIQKKLTVHQKRQLAEVEHELTQLRDQQADFKKKIHRLAGSLYQPDAPFWDRPLQEINAAVGRISLEYVSYADVAARLSAAQERIDSWKKSFTEIAAAPAFGDFDKENIEETLGQVQKSIDEAFTRKQRAEEAGARLELIEKELAALTVAKDKLQGQMNNLQEAVTVLGEGDLQLGVERLKKRQLCNSRLKELRHELAEAGEQGWGKELLAHNLDELRNIAENIDLESELKKRERLRLSRELESAPRPLPYLDEPIRRFILYGGDWAEEWLAGSVWMAVQALTGRSGSAGTGLPLPTRVVNAFNLWRENRQSVSTRGEAAPGSARQRFTAPEIRLEPAGGLSIFLPLQRFRLPGEGIEAWVALSRSAGRTEENRYPLKVYLPEPGLGEIEPVSIPVSRPGGIITITLGFGEEIVQAWAVAASLGGLPCLIFDENGRMVTGEPLSREILWFLLPAGYYLRPRVNPLEEMHAQLAESYYLQLVDLRTVTADQLCIVDSQGVQHPFALNREIINTPRLAGQKITGAMVDEYCPLYRKDSLTVQLPASVKSEPAQWTVLARPRAGYTGTEKEYSLNELQELLFYTQEDLLVDLPLEKASLLGEEACGRYTLILLNPAKQKFRFDVSFITELEIDFSPHLCTPMDAEADPVELRLRCPANVSFSVYPPAGLLKTEAGVTTLSMERTAGYVRGALSWNNLNGITATLPLAIEVPGIRWRIAGLSESLYALWSQQVAELWFGDWRDAGELQLFIAAPLYLSGRARLSLDGVGHSYDALIHKGRVNFNLLPFTDTLSSRPGIHSFSLSLWDEQMNKIAAGCLLFRVRTAWEVNNVDLKQEIENERLHLDISWRDLGQAQNRVLRFWSKSRPWAGAVIKSSIPDGASAVEIDTGLDELPAGAYVLEFTVDDPWSASRVEPVFPRAITNTAVKEIKANQASIGEWEARWLGGDKLSIQGRITAAGSGLPVNIIICGRKGAAWVSWSAEAVTGPDGLFEAVIQAEKKAAHWVGLTVPADPPAYLYAVLPEPAPFYFPLDEDMEMALKAGDSDIVVVKLTGAADFGGDIFLSSSGGKNVLKALQEGRSEISFLLKLADGSDKEARLEIDAEKNDFTLKLQSGAKCTSCNILLPDTAAWYRHSSRLESPRCKSFIPNFETTRARLVAVWDLRPWLQKLNAALPLLDQIPLFNSIENPMPILPDDGSTPVLAALLFEQEKEWMRALQQAGWLE